MNGELSFLHQREAGLEKLLRGDDPIEAIAGIGNEREVILGLAQPGKSVRGDRISAMRRSL